MAITTSRLSLTLSSYIVRRFLSGFFLVLMSISLLIMLIDVLELLRRAAGRDVPFATVLQLAVLKFPEALQEIVPFAVLFGGMYAFWRLTRSSELIVARAAGISIWQILTPAVVTAGILGIAMITAVNPLGAAMLLRFEKMETQLLKGRATLLSVSETGLWLRQADAHNQSVIHALGMAPTANQLRDVTVYLYDGQDSFSSRLDAETAYLLPGQWRLENVLITAPERATLKKEIHFLPTEWTPEKIQDSFSPPETLSFWQLPGFIALLDRAGFAATRHRMYWYGLLAVPFMLSAMVLIAASFSMRMARRGGIPRLIGSGVMFSFLLFFVSDLIFALGLSATIPPVLAAGSPALITALIGLSILLHIEEG